MDDVENLPSPDEAEAMARSADQQARTDNAPGARECWLEIARAYRALAIVQLLPILKQPTRTEAAEPFRGPKREPA